MNNAKNWPLYRGTKVLKGTPMTKSEYCLLRGWAVPADEDPAEKGYAVEYQDGGKPNLTDFEGYVSWSPADVFERSYSRWETYGDKVSAEWSELHDRIEKLAAFIESGNPAYTALPKQQRQLLLIQLGAMRTYASILGARLAIMSEPEETPEEERSESIHEPAITVGEPVSD